MTLPVSRRGLITGLVGFVAAPAIVRASSLMPVKSLPITWIDGELNPWLGLRKDLQSYLDEINHDIVSYGSCMVNFAADGAVSYVPPVLWQTVARST